jgi:hypothetical protein
VHSSFRRFQEPSADFTKLPDMEIIWTPIQDLIVFRPTPIRDERGYFSRTLDVKILAEAGIDPSSFKQENQSRSYQGVRRGLHGRSGAGEASWCDALMALCSTWSSTRDPDRQPSAK